jgi:hypothetical protein
MLRLSPFIRSPRTWASFGVLGAFLFSLVAAGLFTVPQSAQAAALAPTSTVYSDGNIVTAKQIPESCSQTFAVQSLLSQMQPASL